MNANHRTSVLDPELAGLIDRAKKGDGRAFEFIVRQHERRVLRTAGRVLNNWEDARDVAQEVFVRLFRHLRRYDPKKNFEVWLYRITVNVCKDTLRRHRRAPHVSYENELERGRLSEPTSNENPNGYLEAQEGWHVLLRGLATLSTKERLAVVLRDIEGLDTPEVAAALGCRRATVRTHLCRGRIKLKQFRDQESGGSS
jgi:RNA polymerase sigma-70 factor (ECF subfamily)